MALPITEALRNASQSIDIKPQLVFEIDGIDKIFGIQLITSFIKIGDDGLLIGNSWVIGGLKEQEDQLAAISFEGTTSSISQTLDIDKGRGASVSTFQIVLVDFDEEISRIISPGVVVPDILGRKCKIYFGIADNTSWPEDYVTIFRGIIDEAVAGPGTVTFNLSHPDQKKRQGLFLEAETRLTSNIDSSTTTISLDSVTGFLSEVAGPDGSFDSSIKFYIQINDELIQYTSFTGTSLNGVARGALGTVAASHSSGDNVKSFYRLEGNAVDLALKMMLSGKNGNYLEGVSVTNFLNDGASVTANTIWFQGVNLVTKYNVIVGDFVTTVGASNGANNVTLKEITGVDARSDGTLITITGASLVEEVSTSATISFRSQFDTLGEGLGMDNDEVDLSEHLILKARYLSNFDYDFYIKEGIEDVKEFIESQIYLPAACYSLPRKSQASMGIFTPPVPGAEIVTVNKTNILNPNQIKLRRSITKNFINTIVYKFDEQVLEEKFTRGVITTNEDSKNRIKVGSKVFVIESKGMRESLNGINLANLATDRRLDIYRFAAESVQNIKVHFGDAFKVEIGDIIIFDPTDLNVTDLSTGSRDKGARLYFVQNKKIAIKTGEVSLDLIDSGFELGGRYGLISPSSYINTVVSSSQFVLRSSFASVYGSNEGLKWSRYIGETVKVRNSDFSNVDTATIFSVSGNTVTLGSALSFTPSVDDIMELANYNDSSDRIHLIYTYLSDGVSFDDGSDPYLML